MICALVKANNVHLTLGTVMSSIVSGVASHIVSNEDTSFCDKLEHSNLINDAINYWFTPILLILFLKTYLVILVCIIIVRLLGEILMIYWDINWMK